MLFLLANILRYFQHLKFRLCGIKIGKNTMISLHAKLDTHRGKIIIGDRCHITYGCIVLSHDYTAKLLGKGDGTGCVEIGNDVFIGVNSVILSNVKIGNNVIIGAGSVVSGDIPENSVAVGNPAKVIRKIQENA
jgi:acetyltransferase-like isoleucine patch superfamily enzyme